ncbi:glycoside hydrolase family 5 protein [Hypholoma sublateritium FD-334 SS-4]|uniref:Glycoside hydrolase family 5 protein n=1 Tax=Hypholoma sublateritium (strain FD-334 SS-4) TaxID=945553 RepID=A0A0D2KH14_HYPSF|nr:glycoside hydrolase family 5 protein [Hypholoma sublateritium FD-334 SS-4]
MRRVYATPGRAGLNYVRIPIGHWILDVALDEPYITGQLPYLLKAVEWAEKYGVHVIIAPHGAPGSQNGFINSGHFRDAAYWHTNVTNVARTNALMECLAAMFVHKTDVVSVIQVMNENPGLSPRKKRSDFMVMLHDGFQRLSYWDKFMPSSEYEGVMMDTHIYQMFNDRDARMTHAEHIQRACQNASIMAQSPIPLTIIREWTATNNDCAPHLLSRFQGSRYDGTLNGTTAVGSCAGLTGSAAAFSAEYKEFMRQYWEAQTQAYERGGAGWVMWTWKMEHADEWSYQAGLANGWIPQDPIDYKYPNICG